MAETDSARAMTDAARALSNIAAGFQHIFSGNAGGAVSALAAGAKGIGKGITTAGKTLETAGVAGAAEAAEGLAAGLVEVAAPLAAVAAVAAGVALGLKAVYDSAEMAAKALKAVYDAALLSGGSAKDITGLARFGLGPEEAGQLANAFRRATEPGSSPEAMLALSKLGMSPQAPAAFGGPVNNAALLNQALERLRDLPRAEQVRIAGSIPGLEAVLARLNVSPAVQAAQQQNAALAGQVGTPEATKQANDFMEALRLLGSQFDLLKTAAGEGAMKPIMEGLLDLGDAIGKLTKDLLAHPEIMKNFGEMVKFFMESAVGWIGALGDALPVIEQITNAFKGFFDAIYKMLQFVVNKAIDALKAITLGKVDLPHLPDLNFPAKSGAAHDDAMKKHTDALNNHANWMKETINGGGERVRGAQPAGLRGEALANFLKTQKLALGAFSL